MFWQRARESVFSVVSVIFGHAINAMTVLAGTIIFLVVLLVAGVGAAAIYWLIQRKGDDSPPPSPSASAGCSKDSDCGTDQTCDCRGKSCVCKCGSETCGKDKVCSLPRVKRNLRGCLDPRTDFWWNSLMDSAHQDACTYDLAQDFVTCSNTNITKGLTCACSGPDYSRTQAKKSCRDGSDDIVFPRNPCIGTYNVAASHQGHGLFFNSTVPRTKESMQDTLGGMTWKDQPGLESWIANPQFAGD